MAINRSSLSAAPIQQSTESVIEIRTTQPDPSEPLDTPDIPGRLIGYYNGISGYVELYVVGGDGVTLLRI